jgi:hypothetical protein
MYRNGCPSEVMAWPLGAQVMNVTDEGWGPHGWVSVPGRWMEDEIADGKLMLGEMEG